MAMTSKASLTAKCQHEINQLWWVKQKDLHKHYMCGAAGVGVRFQDETLKVKSSFLVLDSYVRSVAGECNSKL